MLRKICALIIIMTLMLNLCMEYDWSEVKAENITSQSDVQQVLPPTGFHGTSDKGVIRLKWKKNKDASGYILLKNGKKLKRLKAKKTSYIDKNVKLNKKYVYSI